MNRRVAWVAVGAAVVVALVVAIAGGSSSHRSEAARANSIAESVRCPTCRGQSVAQSAAPAAQAIRTEIRRRVHAGQSKQQIEQFLEGRYGEDILLTPPRSGIGGLVWIIPVVVVIGAAVGLGLALQRWSRRPLRRATAEDRGIVEGGNGA